MTRVFCVAVGLVCLGAVRTAEATDTARLAAVRELVARNEALIDPIKMAYTIEKNRTGQQSAPTGGRGTTGRRYSHIKCIWAQAEGKHYARQDYFYGPNEPGRSTICVFGPGSVTEAALPDLMQGTIEPKDSHDWYSVMVTKLGLRPFEGVYRLSEILVPEYASVHEAMEEIGGRQTYVVDARRPGAHIYFARIWIDRQRGAALRIHYFHWHPTCHGVRLASEIEDIKLHQLPNGGWIPVEGVRSIHFSDDYSSYEHILVDVDSVTIDQQDITESLFKIDFPTGARIYNAFSGLTTVQGQPLKTYEEMVAAGGSYIDGIVVDGAGKPVSDVVVGVAVVKQGSSMRLISAHERPCAVTDDRGRFALEVEPENAYDLAVYPTDFADQRVQDVRPGGDVVRVTLQKGGAVTGRVVRTIGGRKIPVVNAEVSAEPASRTVSAVVRHHLMHATTDADGRFAIGCLPTTMRRRGSDVSPG